ncbi:trxA [Symbiodinium sp. CCMP2592]|nr:trxA [Symbiodinium sp. CCMP2592]
MLGFRLRSLKENMSPMAQLLDDGSDSFWSNPTWLKPSLPSAISEEDLLGVWADSLGNAVYVSAGTSSQPKLEAVLAKPPRDDIHLSMRPDEGSGWICGNATSRAESTQNFNHVCRFLPTSSKQARRQREVGFGQEFFINAALAMLARKSVIQQCKSSPHNADRLETRPVVWVAFRQGICKVRLENVDQEDVDQDNRQHVVHVRTNANQISKGTSRPASSDGSVLREEVLDTCLNVVLRTASEWKNGSPMMLMMRVCWPQEAPNDARDAGLLARIGLQDTSNDVRDHDIPNDACDVVYLFYLGQNARASLGGAAQLLLRRNLPATVRPTRSVNSPNTLWEDISEKFEGRFLKMVQVDVTDIPEAAREFRVDAVPYFLVLRDGHVVERLLGNEPKAVAEAAERHAAAFEKMQTEQ